MIPLPPHVKSTFLRLKRESSKYLEIKHIKNYFFVYQSTSIWDKERKKPIKVPLYLGRITNSGEFIQAQKRKPRGNTNQQSTTKTENVVLDTAQKTLETVSKEEKHYKHEAKFLTALSMNGRIPISVLGKMVGLKETAVSSQIKKLERRYKIRYMAEIDTTKFGYIQFLITVKFLDVSPKVAELKNVLLKENGIQLALTTKGDFHLIIYALAKDSSEINYLVGRLRRKMGYRSIWNTAPVEEDYGFIPLRVEFLDLVKDKLLVREYAILKELIINGGIDFSEIDRKYNFDRGRSQYSYYKLKEQGILKRVTISMENLPIKYVGIIVETIVDRDNFTKNREKSLLNIIEDTKSNSNSYLLVDDMVSPDGSILYLPVFNYSDLEYAVETISDLNLGIRIKTLITSDILVGNFCYRSFDNSYSIQAKILSEEYKMKLLQKIDYEKTGRIKKEQRGYADIRGLKPINL